MTNDLAILIDVFCDVAVLYLALAVFFAAL